MNDIQFKVFAFIVAQVETPLVDAVSQVVNAFLAFVAAPLKVALVLYIALTGVLILRGQAGAAGSTLIGRFIKLGLVVWVLTGAGVYQHLVYDFFFTTLPQALSRSLTSAGSGVVAADSFDKVWLQAWRTGMDVWRNLGWQDIPEKLIVVLFWLAAIISTVLSFAIWLVSRVLLALYIALGPLLIGLVLFPATRSIFERWIGSLISCVILQISTAVLLVIILAVELQVIEQVVLIGAGDPMAMIQVLMAGVIFFAVATFVAFQLPGVASSLAGGLHFHSGVIGRGMRGAVGSVGRTYFDAQRNPYRVGDHGALGLLGAGASLTGQGMKSAGRAVYQRIRPSPGSSLSDGKRAG